MSFWGDNGRHNGIRMETVGKEITSQCWINRTSIFDNIHDVVNNGVKVWGVLVLFGPSDINSYHSLIDVGKGDYKNYLNDVDYKDVIETLL